MAEKLGITYEKSEEIAKRIIETTEKMNDLLENRLTTDMRTINTDQTMASAGAGAVLNKFETELKPEFQVLRENLIGYANYVLKSVEEYRSADDALKNAANN